MDYRALRCLLSCGHWSRVTWRQRQDGKALCGQCQRVAVVVFVPTSARIRATHGVQGTLF